MWGVRLLNIFERRGNMKICVSNVDKMKEIWNNIESPTTKYFINGMENGNIELWTVEKYLIYDY